MWRSRKVSLLLPIIAVGIGWVVWQRWNREPVVQGRPLSEWAMALQGPEPVAPAQAVIKQLGPEEARFFARMLQTKDSSLKGPLERYGPKLPKKTEQRLRLLIRPELGERKRLGGAMALGLIGTNAAPALDDLLAALRSPEPNLRLYASLALAGIGANSVPGLSLALSDPESNVRSAAAFALSSIGPAAAPAAPQLVEVMVDPQVHAFAVVGLKTMGRDGVKHLVKSLESKNPDTTPQTLQALSELGSVARPAIPVVLALATNRAGDFRLEAVRALAGICARCPEVSQAASQLRKDPDPAIRKAAAEMER